MKINNQLEQPLTTPERPGETDVDMAARRPLYHPAARPRLGRVLRGRYRLESLLGMGAMGEVYRAVDLQLQQPCAVKLVFPGAVFGLKAHRRFDNEARVIARLFHPNIVEVRDFNEDEDGTKFLVMELLEGQDLHQLLSRQGRLPLPRAMEIIRAVGAALQYAHDMGIVHRDVKPENIFLGTRGRLDGRDGEPGEREQIKVLDFGLAKLLSEPAGEERPTDPGGTPAQLTSGIIIGTLAYLSPEATCMDSSGVDARSDQWSLAVVAYQLLSGRLPFGNSHPIGLWQMICSEEPVRLRTLVPGLPAHIDSAIHTALAKQRNDRFPRVADFIRSLGNLPQLGGVDSPGAAVTADAGYPVRPTAPTALIAAPATAAADPMWEADGDPTEVEPYLPGLTRARLALLPGPGQRSVPEFVEPDRERILRVPTSSPAVSTASPRREQSAPHPDMLVTAHYTAEQLLELSGMVNLRDAQALVHAAQDVPTAPYRLGGRSAKDLDDAFDRTPLPVPRPMCAELSARLEDDRRRSPEPAIARECQLTATLVPTGEPTQPAGASGSVFATLRAELQQQAALPVGLAKAAGLAVSAAPSAPAAAGSAAPALLPPPRPPAIPSRAAGRASPPRPPAAAFAESARRAPASSPVPPQVSSQPVPLAAPQQPAMAAPPPRPALQMPALLTLAGTVPPELGSPLQLALPRLRWPLWRALGASSVVLGLLVAALLGLRLVRPKAVSSGATVGRPPALLSRSSAAPLVELAQAAAPTTDPRAARREPPRPPAFAPSAAPPPVQTPGPRPLQHVRQLGEQSLPAPDSPPASDSLPESESPLVLDSLLSSHEHGYGQGQGQGPAESSARLAE